MQKFITIILLFTAALCFSQTKQSQIDNAVDLLSTNMLVKADTAFAQLNRIYPADSMVIRNEAAAYWRFGRVKDNTKLLNHSIGKFQELEARYPGNPEINLFIATAIVKRCDITYFSMKTPENEKKALLSEYKSAKEIIEKHLPKLDQLQYAIVSIAKKDLETINSRIEQITKL